MPTRLTTPSLSARSLAAVNTYQCDYTVRPVSIFCLQEEKKVVSFLREGKLLYNYDTSFL